MAQASEVLKCAFLGGEFTCSTLSLHLLDTRLIASNIRTPQQQPGGLPTVTGSEEGKKEGV